MTKPSFAKRHYLINRDFQLRYARSAVFVGLGSTMLTVFLILFPLFQFGIVRYPNFLPPPFMWAIAIAAVLNFSVVAFFGIMMTHRIAGPMYSLVRHFRVMQLGHRVGYLRVREQDELKFVVRNFNELIDYLGQRAVSDQDAIDAVVAQLRGGDLAEASRLAEALAINLRQRNEVPDPSMINDTTEVGAKAAKHPGDPGS